MKDVMGIINLMENEEFLKEVTQHRPAAAIPIGGRYRMIDFILSNMVNSGIRNIGIIVQTKYRALMDHLGNGKDWDLDRKRDGLFYLPPAYFHYPLGIYRWDIRHFHSHLDYISYSRQKYVIISGSNMICNLDFRPAFNFHRQMQADITVLYKEEDALSEDLSQFTIIETAADGRIVDMAMQPDKISSTKVSMEMYIMEKSLLVELINRCSSRGECDLIKDGIIKNLDRLKIYGYPHQGYLAQINSITSYFRHNMDLLNPAIWQQLFFKPGLIYTKVKDGAPTKYAGDSSVQNAIIANDCIIEGTVENSIIFRGVHIYRGAYVKDSIIMQKTTIAEDARVEYVIADKEVFITKGKHLKGEKDYPLVIKKKTVI
ncbi:glucose-1-phosphate adenylyltransferase, GlgD subunit [Desulfotomaculum nigrificans CO-1-SRB]|uniref:Glucose-1-phosphate adenylyltransferase, GlgD subunit n=1 Tax=Desulfotomaculum nigrificans (strain DSM 14880 / VKM B-2319 / CO-1-SRB) TaxID=868595 RepID=F6B9X7_DESCC|nr:glucose-1-phosphate adenylyltransferase subunit GlgD [Desulfotomaculum nigrificans]AEF93825.1 glucose-1-phosphate adenylyltransferase, GlgD subunit [Desulfotomaculum nigrificans CO-1-SRB]